MWLLCNPGEPGRQDLFLRNFLVNSGPEDSGILRTGTGTSRSHRVPARQRPRDGRRVPCQNQRIAADLPFRVRKAALRYSLIKPPRTCPRSIRAVISMARPGAAEESAAGSDARPCHWGGSGRGRVLRASDAGRAQQELRAVRSASAVGADYSCVLVRPHAVTRGGCRRAGPVCGHRGARSAQDW
jgi:hypothetical protein